MILIRSELIDREGILSGRLYCYTLIANTYRIHMYVSCPECQRRKCDLRLFFVKSNFTTDHVSGFSDNNKRAVFLPMHLFLRDWLRPPHFSGLKELSV